jgi:hypothetical protein
MKDEEDRTKTVDGDQENFPTGLDWDGRFDTEDHHALEFHASFHDLYKDELDDIRWRVGLDRENAISSFADRLMESDDGFTKDRGDIIDLIESCL